MNKEQEYDDLCRRIWDFYASRATELGKSLELDLSKLMLPPSPRDKPIAVLFVGLSPSRDPKTEHWFGETLRKAKDGARARDYNDFPTYYGPLLKIAKLADPKLGFWNEDSERLIEFTDLCHWPVQRTSELPHRRVRRNRELLKLFKRHPDVRDHCKATLKKELRLYKPEVVVCNGSETSKGVWEIWGEPGDFDPSKQRPFFWCRDLRCTFHLSGFLTPPRPLDVYNRRRLADELHTALNRRSSTPRWE